MWLVMNGERQSLTALGCNSVLKVSYNNNNIHFNIAKTNRSTNNTSYRHVCHVGQLYN